MINWNVNKNKMKILLLDKNTYSKVNKDPIRSLINKVRMLLALE